MSQNFTCDLAATSRRIGSARSRLLINDLEVPDIRSKDELEHITSFAFSYVTCGEILPAL